MDNNYNIKAHIHGTHVAGIIAAVGNNNKGCAGIAGGLDGKGGVSIMNCQIIQDNPEDPEHDLTGNVYDAIVWGADHGAVISQNSWCYTYDTEEEALNDNVGPLSTSIDYFIKYAGTDKDGNQAGPMKGGVVIFAAGNDAWKISWPGAYPPVVAVGAVGPDYSPAYYTNYGDWVDIAAPGGSSLYENGRIYSTILNDEYAWLQGTSMACPHVSGVAALLVSYFGGPGFTNDMLLERLLGGANHKAVFPGAKIGPLCDAFGSFAYGSTIPPATPESHTVTAKSNSLVFSAKIPSDPDEKFAYGLLMLASKNKESLETLDPHNIPEDVASVKAETGDLSLNDTLSATIEGLEFCSGYYTAVAAYDYCGNYSALSPLVTVSTGENNPPVISSSSDGVLQVKAHEAKSLGIHIIDPDGHDFTVGFVPGSDAAISSELPDGTYEMTVLGRNADTGKYVARYEVADGYGAVASAEFEYEILPNHAPSVILEPKDILLTAKGQKTVLCMSDYLSDPDGEQLSYKISAAPAGTVSLGVDGNYLNITALARGYSILTISGIDVRKEKASVNLKVLVREPEAEPDVYPSIVSDYLKVSDGPLKTLRVCIYGSSGVLLYDENVTCDAFEPAKIDMRNWAPGRYGILVVSGEKKFNTTVVKI